MHLRVLSYLRPQGRVVKSAAQHISQVVFAFVNQPSGAYRIIVFLALLVGYIPRLPYLSKLRQLIITADPGALHHRATGGHRLLLILGRKGLRTC